MSRKRVPNRAQIQPTGGVKWACGKAIREFREAKKISQERLAADSGLDRSFVSLLERGLQSPNVAVLFKIAEVLDVRASEIIARIDELMKKPRAVE